MASAQRMWRESLRDIEACLPTFGSRPYDIGSRSPVARDTLANADALRRYAGRSDRRAWSIVLNSWRKMRHLAPSRTSQSDAAGASAGPVVAGCAGAVPLPRVPATPSPRPSVSFVGRLARVGCAVARRWRVWLGSGSTRSVAFRTHTERVAPECPRRPSRPCGADRRLPYRAICQRCLPAHDPGWAVHCIGARTRLVLEQDVGPVAPRILSA